MSRSLFPQDVTRSLFRSNVRCSVRFFSCLRETRGARVPFGFLPCQQTSENIQATDDVTKHMFPNLGFHVHSFYIFYHFFMSKPVFTLKRLHFQHMSNSHHMSSRCCALPPRGNFDVTDVLFVSRIVLILHNTTTSKTFTKKADTRYDTTISAVCLLRSIASSIPPWKKWAPAHYTAMGSTNFLRHALQTAKSLGMALRDA